MKVFLTDLPNEALDAIVPDSAENFIAQSNELRVHPCIGCMRCLLSKPGSCAISDRFSETVEAITECDELIIFSDCFFGSLSAAVKASVDRLFPYFQGEMEESGGAVSFATCIPRPKKLSVWFYGTEDAQLRKTARSYCRTLADAWGLAEAEVRFVDMAEDLVDAFAGGVA